MAEAAPEPTNDDFALGASAWVNLLNVASGSVSSSLSRSSGQVRFISHLTGHVQFGPVSADLDAGLTITVSSSGQIYYAGSATADV